MLLARSSVALTQARSNPDTIAFLNRRAEQGPTRKEASRSLKRRLSDVIFRAMLADAALNQNQHHQRAAWPRREGTCPPPQHGGPWGHVLMSPSRGTMCVRMRDLHGQRVRPMGSALGSAGAEGVQCCHSNTSALAAATSIARHVL